MGSPERLKELKKTHINLVKMTHDELKKIKELDHALYLSNFKYKNKNNENSTEYDQSSKLDNFNISK